MRTPTTKRLRLTKALITWHLSQISTNTNTIDAVDMNKRMSTLKYLTDKINGKSLPRMR
ncbi:MAG: hypothetical protein ACK505_06165 [Flavobacteriales bacterium]|jgi:hypothetical protein